jgi:ribonuclease Z
MITSNDYDIMIDCGEGSYLHWQKYGYHWKNLKYIFITHMHPDHTGGLLPFLFYRKLYNIESSLTLIGPPNLEAYLVDSFQHTGIKHNQDLHYINIAEHSEIKLDKGIRLHALEMEHKIPCWGYALEDKKRKLVFITDTRSNTNAIKLANKADVLIHEATFQHDQRDKALEHFHVTEIQAMEIADSAQVKRLVLTHFSPRLTDSDVKEWTWQGQPCVVFDERQKI